MPEYTVPVIDSGRSALPAIGRAIDACRANGVAEEAARQFGETLAPITEA